MNGVAVELNLAAFRWGRRAAVDPALVEGRATASATVPDSHRLSETLDQIIERRISFLTEYQNAAYAARYAGWIRRLSEVETARLLGRTELTQTVARALFKLMAYKDEYEVARLYTESDFLKRVADRFEGAYELNFHLAPPVLGDRDPETGHLRKRSFGPRMLWVFRILARMRGLRGTRFDIFGRTQERRTERQLIGEYQDVIEEILACLSPANHATAVELAALPLEIRGFGHIKRASIVRVTAKEEALLARFRSAPSQHAVAAE